MFFILLIILLLLIEKLINKILGVKKKKISETAGKNIDRWRRGLILVIFICTYPVAIYNDFNIKWFFISYAILFMGSESLMEWIYIKNSKQYMTSLILLIFLVIIIYNIESIYHIVQY